MVSPDTIVGIIGNVISILVYAAPLGTFSEVVKKKSAENYDVLPYITTLLCKSLWTFYGTLDPNGLLLITVNGLGVISESVYVILYLIYAPKDKKVKTLILVAIMNIAFVGFVIALAIAVFHNESHKLIFMGVLCATVTAAMYAAPLKAMRSVLKTKSVEYMPFSLTFVLLLNAACWFTFALIQRNCYVIVPNAIGILSSSSQIILYLIYKNKSPQSKSAVMAEEELGSRQLVKEGIKMQKLDNEAAKTKNHQSLSRGNSLPKPAMLRQYSLRKIIRTLSMSTYEFHPNSDMPIENDIENTRAVAQA